MAKYLFIESRDPFDSADAKYFPELVQSVANRAEAVTLALVQNGVLAARPGSNHSEQIAQLMKNKVKVLADGFSLKERAINRPLAGIEVTDMDRLVTLLLEPGTKAIWH